MEGRPVTAPNSQKNPVRPTSADPAVDISHEIQRLWDAKRGYEVLIKKLPDDSITERSRLWRCYHQITEWRDALETVATFTVATSLEGALVQLALAQHEALRIGDGSGDLDGVVDSINRLLRSARDVIFDTLGDRVKEVRTSVKVYSWIGNQEKQRNWLSDDDGFEAAALIAEDAADAA